MYSFLPISMLILILLVLLVFLLGFAVILLFLGCSWWEVGENGKKVYGGGCCWMRMGWVDADGWMRVD